MPARPAPSPRLPAAADPSVGAEAETDGRARLAARRLMALGAGPGAASRLDQIALLREAAAALRDADGRGEA